LCFRKDSSQVKTKVKAPIKNFKKRGSASRTRICSVKNQKAIRSEAKALADPLCGSEGLELVHIEYQRESGGWTLRLYIDKAGGVTLDDCVNISRQMNDLLDVHLEEIGPYNLEVTSPGPDRPLAKKHDFERFKGSLARIRTVRALNGQKNFKGVLGGISAEQVKLLIGEETVRIPLEDISKARLVK